MQDHRQASTTAKASTAHASSASAASPGKTSLVQQQAQGGPLAQAASSNKARQAIIDAGKGSLNEMKRGLETMSDAFTDTGDTIKQLIHKARVAANKCDIPGLQVAIDQAAVLIAASWTSALLKQVKDMTEATHDVLDTLEHKDDHGKHETIREYLETLVDAAHNISDSAKDHEEHTKELNQILVDAKQLCGSLVPTRKVQKFSSGDSKLTWSFNPTLTDGITLKRSFPKTMHALPLPGHGHIDNVKPLMPHALQHNVTNGPFALAA
ncbi:MAG TPA: hypothetical protein VHT91_39735 [Kofleriaceae bacterium]|jgi:hypothetical protein|nr:hypothetical protein [Kofleriaceae bacterium]